MIVFTKAISQDRLLMAFNNNIIRFYSDSALIPASAEIIGLGFPVILYPHPNGRFYFNFKEYIPALIETNNFQDIVDDQFIYDWTNNVYLKTILDIKIKFTNNTDETTSLDLNWLSAYLQLDEFTHTQFPSNSIDDTVILTPFYEYSDKKAFIKMWSGYPIDITVYSKRPELRYCFNQTKNIDTDIYTISRALLYETGSSIGAFSSGFSNGFLIDDSIFNDNETQILQLKPVNENEPVLFELTIKKEIPSCNGTYIKWINRYGGWNYWLFKKGNSNLSTKGLGEINNDFSNLEDTTSQTENIGVNSLKSIFVKDDLNEQEMLLMSDLFESPKVYLFTGMKNDVDTYNSWIAVNIKEKSNKIIDGKQNFINVNIEIELPARTTRTL